MRRPSAVSRRQVGVGRCTVDPPQIIHQFSGYCGFTKGLEISVDDYDSVEVCQVKPTS